MYVCKFILYVKIDPTNNTRGFIVPRCGKENFLVSFLVTYIQT